MALDKSEDWRKGNPKWKKGHKEGGRPEGSRAKANSSTKRTLNRLDRHPVEELIKIADIALGEKDYKFAREIWEKIHDESTAHNTEEINEQKKAEKTLVKELENATDTGTAKASNTPSVGNGKPPVQAEANPADHLRQLESLSGTDLRDKLQPPTGKVNDDGNAGVGDSATNPK